MAKTLIMVLDDGETFSPASGCYLVEIEEKGLDKMQNRGFSIHQLEEEEFVVICEFK